MRLLCYFHTGEIMKIITSGNSDHAVIDSETGDIQWSFSLQKSVDLTEDERSWVDWYGGKSDECKPIDEGKRILITSVSGLVCIVDIKTKKLHKLAWMPGAHSAEQISKNLFAAAISLKPALPPGAPDIYGDYIALIDAGCPGKEICRDACKSAHAAVWNRDTETLWTLGFETIRSYTILQNPVFLLQTGSYPLPNLNGHDLSPVPGTQKLYVSTGKHVFIFDTETGEFEKHPSIGDCESVKSISHHPETGEVMFVGADQGEYRSDTIRFESSNKTISYSGTYKARWLC